jgi:hypothetical protein
MEKRHMPKVKLDPTKHRRYTIFDAATRRSITLSTVDAVEVSEAVYDKLVEKGVVPARKKKKKDGDAWPST